MTKLSFTLPKSTFTVSKRDGASIDVEMSQIPAELFAAFLIDGVAEYLRDSSASALAIAYDAAHEGHTLDDEELKAARKEWATPERIAPTSMALMSSALDRLYAGERRIVRASAPKDSLDDYRIAVVLDMIRQAPETDVATAYAAIPSDDQPARRAFRLDIAAKNAAIVDPMARNRMEADAAKAKAMESTTLAL